MGNGYSKASDQIEFAGIDCDKVVVAQLKHDKKIPEGQRVVIQAALLFTTASGQRRIRVHTLALDTSTSMSNVFKSADLDAILSVYCRSAAQQCMKTQNTQVRQSVIDRCIAILATYRKLCATRSASAQLILPETLKLLPIYTLGMLKSPLLSASRSIDEKVFVRQWVEHCPLETLSLYLYPRLFDVLNIPEDCQSVSQDGYVDRTPPILRLQTESLKSDSLYMMDCGIGLYLWVGPQVPSEVLQKIFNIPRVDGVSMSNLRVQAPGDDPLLRRLHATMRTLRHKSSDYKALHIVSPSDPSSLSFRDFCEFLVEDRTKTTLSYVDFLCHVHRQIQIKVGEN
tara:strand:+ start:101 stop:1123 length:1023 start_codon:yes stop_codon:yes gene_type:complete